MATTKPKLTELKCIGFQKFHFKPFGRFLIKMDHKKYKSINVLEFNNLKIFDGSRLKVTPVTDKRIVKLMIDNKTDILVDGLEFWTRMGEGIARVDHYKIQELLKLNYHRDYYFGSWVENEKTIDPIPENFDFNLKFL